MLNEKQKEKNQNMVIHKVTYLKHNIKGSKGTIIIRIVLYNPALIQVIIMLKKLSYNFSRTQNNINCSRALLS